MREEYQQAMKMLDHEMIEERRRRWRRVLAAKRAHRKSLEIADLIVRVAGAATGTVECAGLLERLRKERRNLRRLDRVWRKGKEIWQARREMGVML